MNVLRAMWVMLPMAAAVGCGDDMMVQADRDAAMDETSCDHTISLVDFKLVPAEITADVGTVVLCARNDGKAPHDLAVRDDAGTVLGRTKVLGPDEEDRFSLDLSAGAFDIFCTQGGHESLGMKGTVTVE